LAIRGFAPTATWLLSAQGQVALASTKAFAGAMASQPPQYGGYAK